MLHESETLERRAQSIAELTICAVRMNSNPADAAPIVEAVERILEIAADAPGGWAAVIDGLKASQSAQDVAAFCRAYVNVLTVESRNDECNPVHDFAMPDL